MNFKKIGFGLAAAITVAAGTAVVEAPAQAASLADNPLTGILDIDLNNLVESIDATFVDFGANNTLASPGTTSLGATRFTGSTGSFASITSGSIKDLPIFANFPNNGIDDFITVSNASGTVTFDLLELIEEDLDANTKGGSYHAKVRGIFNPTGQVNNSFEDLFNVRLTARNNEGSLEITPVPTPALLPGLIGMGIAALRKKKQEEVA